jgi:GNAT superfamily N-acetyltransferase
VSNTPADLAARISLRPVVLPDDEEFLTRLYISTRDDLTSLPLDDGQKNSILQMQYAAQKQQYELQFPNAAHDIVMFDERRAGRLLSVRGADEILGVDLALLPDYRNLGIGSVVLGELIEEAARTDRIFGLHVLKTNRAARLYVRLGLVVTEETQTHYKMERRPLRPRLFPSRKKKIA